MLVYCCFAAGLHCLCRTDISTYNCYMYLKYQLMQEPSIFFCIVLLFFSWNHMKRTCFNMHSVHVIVVYLKISWCRNRPFTIFVLGLWRNRGYCEDWYLGWRLFHLHQCCESFELLCWRWNCHHCPLRQVCSYLCIMFQGQMRDFFFLNMFDHLTLSSTRMQHTVHDKEMFWNFSCMHTGFWFGLQADHYQRCSTSVSLSLTKFELFGKACQREVCKGSGANNDCQTPCRLWLARFAPGLKLPWEGKSASAAVQMMRAWVFLWFILWLHLYFSGPCTSLVTYPKTTGFI